MLKNRFFRVKIKRERQKIQKWCRDLHPKKEKIFGENKNTGLVVMGVDSCSKGHGFESQHHILNGHYFTFICCKKCNFCFEKTKINEEEAEDGPFLKNKVITRTLRQRLLNTKVQKHMHHLPVM